MQRLLLLVLLLLVAACDSTRPAPEPDPIDGFWQGKYSRASVDVPEIRITHGAASFTEEIRLVHSNQYSVEGRGRVVAETHDRIVLDLFEPMLRDTLHRITYQPTLS